MARAKAKGRTDGFSLVIILLTLLIMLFGLVIGALWFDEVADASPFGRAGTVVVAVVMAVIAVASTIVAARGMVAARRVASVACFAAAVVALVLALFILLSGGIAISLGFLLGYATLAFGLIGNAVLRNTTSATGG
ncbi:hypothetical protein KOI35_14960 [Actinoplanes bogorensis]|uniref:Integral membrane protein n=1 Tax=Paractinoplanes bogorensis TaxID=1610840 RepID=A0ABS5YRZ7_9ACTN|nr:hypothetical protein [Actinoplanes bogorensis]MBU2664800.1 hypothetical protein [Actinoplanes bogorensis]